MPGTRTCTTRPLLYYTGTMKRVGKDILYFEIGKDNAPVVEIDPGEAIEIETQMNRGPWIDDHPDREAL